MSMPTRLYDLSQPVYHNCPGWPDQTWTSITWDYRVFEHGFNAETVTFNTHTGTHLDMPYHFLQDGKRIEDFPVDHFAGPVVFFDLRKVVKPDTAISAEDIAPYMSRVSKDDIVVLCTGYGQKRAVSNEYLHEFPFLSGPGAELLVKAGVKGVGTDALSMGGWGVAEKGRPPHMALLTREIFILEELCIPEELLDGKKRYLTAFPILLQGCGGGPARAVVYDFD